MIVALRSWYDPDPPCQCEVWQIVKKWRFDSPRTLTSFFDFVSYYSQALDQYCFIKPTHQQRPDWRNNKCLLAFNWTFQCSSQALLHAWEEESSNKLQLRTLHPLVCINSKRFLFTPITVDLHFLISADSHLISLIRILLKKLSMRIVRTSKWTNAQCDCWAIGTVLIAATMITILIAETMINIEICKIVPCLVCSYPCLVSSYPNLSAWPHLSQRL